MLVTSYDAPQAAAWIQWEIWVFLDVLLGCEVLCQITLQTRQCSCMTITVGLTGSTAAGKTPLRRENLCGAQMHSSVCWTCRALKAANKAAQHGSPEMCSSSRRKADNKVNKKNVGTQAGRVTVLKNVACRIASAQKLRPVTGKWAPVWHSLCLKDHAGSPLRNPVTSPVGEVKIHCYSDPWRRGLDYTVQTLRDSRKDVRKWEQRSRHIS